MGDRHNIGLVQYDRRDDGPRDILWLYSHSGFYVENPPVEGFAAVVALALDEARPRWDDHSYFNRIIILTLGDSIRGISLGRATGDEHKRWVIDSEKREVYLMDNNSWLGELADMPDPIICMGFEKFIEKYRHHDKTVRGEY